MSTDIGKDLRAKLRDVVGENDTTIAVAGDGSGVAVDVEGCDRYAVGVRGIRVAPAQPLADVGEAAQRIADQVDAIERLRVVEYDSAQQEAILRSAEPDSDDVGIIYWEATVKPDDTSLHRYHKTHSEPDRVPVVEPMTHRQVGDLAGQLVDAMQGDAE